jgi:hypothetical protein
MTSYSEKQMPEINNTSNTLNRYWFCLLILFKKTVFVV